jgi:RNA polymerase primary sigma factor
VSSSAPHARAADAPNGAAFALANRDAFVEHLRAQARYALTILSATEARVIRMRYGIGTRTRCSVVETARHLGLTSARVRQIEVNALRKLRHGGTHRGRESARGHARSEWTGP